MAQFTNFATLTYSGGSTSSNTVTGELVDLVHNPRPGGFDCQRRDLILGGVAGGR